jgi:hypothetical protein
MCVHVCLVDDVSACMVHVHVHAFVVWVCACGVLDMCVHACVRSYYIVNTSTYLFARGSMVTKHMCIIVSRIIHSTNYLLTIFINW